MKNNKALETSAVLHVCEVDGEEMTISLKDRFANTMIVGPVGSGITTLVKPMVFKDIEYIVAGGKASVVVVEPHKEVTTEAAKLCEKLGVPYLRVDLEQTPFLSWNPLTGDPVMVAESVSDVLGDNEQAFFQELNKATARVVTLVVKYALGANAKLHDLSKALHDPKVLRGYVDDLKKRCSKSENQEAEILDVIEKIEYYMTDERFEQHCEYVYHHLSDMLMDGNIRDFVSGVNSIRLSEFAVKPGVLLITSGNRKSGFMLSKFILNSLRDAVMSRDEKSEMPLFTYIEDFGCFATEGYITSLMLGLRFKWANVITMQSFFQLGSKLDSINHISNRIILTGLGYEDASIASKLLGNRISPDELMYMQKDRVAFKISSIQETGENITGIGAI